jgi:2-polyprenyl-3-methyl-5-hydroxy-6-metoxy-1,4-benzoquinol methylase
MIDYHKCSEKIYSNSGNVPLLELLPRKKMVRLLDCGCGSGDNARILCSWGWEVTGITISPLERDIALNYCSQVEIADLEHGIPSSVGKNYDLVLMSHILEHLVCPQNLIKDAQKVLGPEGVIGVALPNVLVYSNRLKLFIGKFKYTPGGVMDETHVRFYTFASGAELLRSNGLEVIIARAEGNFPLWKFRNILPKAFVKKLNEMACAFRPGFFGTQSLYLAVPNIR